MICHTCGRQIQNKEANFCEYCGASFRERKGYEVDPLYDGSSIASAPLPPPMPQAAMVNKKEKPVSFLDWLGTYLIMFIPLVGSIIFIIMMFVWSFGRNVSESKKNWAKATLLMTLIMFIILTIFFSNQGFMQILNSEIAKIDELINGLQ